MTERTRRKNNKKRKRNQGMGLLCHSGRVRYNQTTEGFRAKVWVGHFSKSLLLFVLVKSWLCIWSITCCAVPSHRSSVSHIKAEMSEKSFITRNNCVFLPKGTFVRSTQERCLLFEMKMRRLSWWNVKSPLTTWLLLILLWFYPLRVLSFKVLNSGRRTKENKVGNKTDLK